MYEVGKQAKWGGTNLGQVLGEVGDGFRQEMQCVIKYNQSFECT
jgi:hypothetical protein